MSKRVVVFVDYENMHRRAAVTFRRSSGHFSPWALAESLVARRNGDDGQQPSTLRQVRVYRGLPDARLQPTANAANHAQTARWIQVAPDPGSLHVYRRPLRYPASWPDGGGSPQEKGVDVALAVDLVQLAYQGAFDVAIVCSHDSDLTPALDVVATVATSRVHLEVAAWGRRSRIGYSHDPMKPWCHHLDVQDFEAVTDDERAR